MTAGIKDLEKKQGNEPVNDNITKKINKNRASIIRVHKDSEVYKFQSGFRQGDIISLKFFTVVLEEVFNQFDFKEKALNTNGEDLKQFKLLLIISFY